MTQLVKTRAKTLGTGVSGSLQVTVPSSVQVGDTLLVYAFVTEGSTIPFNTPPAGWTQAVTQLMQDGTIPATAYGAIFWKIASSGDAGSNVTFTGPSGTYEGGIAAYYATASSPINVTGSQEAVSPVSSLAFASVTTTAANCQMVGAVYAYSSSSQGVSGPAITITLPGTTELNSGSSTTPHGLCDTTAASAGSNAIGTVTSSGNADWLLMQVALTPMSSPLAPTLTAPANAVYQDMSGTPTASWTPNPSPGNGTQNAYAFRRKVSGAGSYSYWNASTSSWQSTIVWNPSAVSSVTFPAAAWADGSIYNWSVATQESVDSLQGPFASDFTVTAQTPPVVTVTAPTGASANMTPAVTWTVQLAAGATQTGFRVVVYTAAQYTAGGFSAGTSSGVADSGQINTNATTWTIPAGALANGTTYRAYVQATETGGETSAWAYSGWTLSVDTPAPPIVTATTGTDPTTGLPLANLTVQGTDNLLSVNDASMEGGVGSWGNTVNASVAQSTAQALDGSYSLAITATAAGDASASTGVGTSGYPVQVGQTYTATLAWRAAATARTVNTIIEWYNAAGTLLSTVNGNSAADSTTGWTATTATATAPTSAAFVAVKGYITGAAASETHYVDEAGIRPGTDPSWYRGGLVGTTTAAILRSDGLYVRNASTANPLTIPASTQTATVVDPELVPANGYTWIGSVSSVQSPTVTLTGPSSQATAQVTLNTGKWWQFDPTDLTTAIAAQITDFNPQITEQAAAHTVLGQRTPNVIASVMGGVDGTATFETFDTATYQGLTKLLTSQKTVFISDPFGDNQGVNYVRFGPQTGGMSGGAGLKAKDAKLHPSTSAAPHHELSITWVAAPRPAV